MTTTPMMQLIKDAVKDAPFPYTTFRLIEVSKDSPFLEARFNYYNKELVIVSKEKYTAYRMLNKLDEFGEPMLQANQKKLKAGDQPKYKMERREVDINYDYMISHEDDVRFFVKSMIGELPADFDTYFTAVQLAPPVDPTSVPDGAKLSVVTDAGEAK
jgi:hypothetical protein